jgi:hypothetical protein
LKQENNISEFVVCDHFNRCDDSHNCGAARLHNPKYCEPCTCNIKAKCIPVLILRTECLGESQCHADCIGISVHHNGKNYTILENKEG